jgi:Tat protein secretion system quality control protein TatD with DNase activity
VSLAGEFQRPVSVHCVRGSGHLLAFFTHLASSTPLSACPPSIMLHSYGGSVEEIPRFCGLKGLGPRFFFSFSAAINQRTPDKLRARIAAVPDDRLLIESDQVGGHAAAAEGRQGCGSH